jgi:hypothetical protein
MKLSPLTSFVIAATALIGFFAWLSDSGNIINEAPYNNDSGIAIGLLNEYHCAEEFINQEKGRDYVSDTPKQSDIAKDIKKSFGVCILQNNRNLQSHTFSAMKIRYLKGWSGALDTAISISMANDDESLCIKNARIIQAMCPTISAKPFINLKFPETTSNKDK